MKHFALIGNPNCGKTTLFNNLTGSTAHVGNWPGVTVDKKDGIYKNGSEKVSIIDLPGIYSLSPYTDEEVISRNYILDEVVDCVINIVDATNLQRNLYLTTQLLEMNVPVVVALNMMDIVTKNGERIDVKALENKLGVPVKEISALKEDNIDELMELAIKASNTKRNVRTVIKNKTIQPLIEDIVNECKKDDFNNPLYHAIKLIEGDELEGKYHPSLVEKVSDFKREHKDPIFGDDYESLIADARYEFIEKDFDAILTKSKDVVKSAKRTSKIDRVLTNKWAGIPIFIAILFVVFHLTFSTDLFYLNALGAFGADGLLSFEGTMFEGLFADGGINSPGVFLQTFVTSITDWLSGVVAGWIESGGAAPWVSAFVVDGVLAGLFSVLSFLPQILVLFLFLSILEDTGYMARVAFILDRLFHKFGLSGRALMPLIMGFGCSVPAMMGTRTLLDEKERIATIRVIPFFSCSAKLPILTAICGAIVSFFGVGNADLIAMGMYVLGMATAIIAIILMRGTTMKGRVSPLVMELPTYHLPQFKALMIHLSDKAKHFIKKAFTIVLASTIIIWFVNHFTWDWKFLEEAETSKSILASIGQLIQPIFTPLGFGSQLTSAGWVFAVAALTGLIAKEDVINTFGTLAAAIVAGFSPELMGDGVAATEALIGATGITVPGLIAFIAFNMLTIPCFAAVATARGELTKKKFNWTLLFWIVTSVIVSSAVYVIGSWWWTCFIYVAVVAAAILGINLYNKKHSKILEVK